MFCCVKKLKIANLYLLLDLIWIVFFKSHFFDAKYPLEGEDQSLISAFKG
jgi:hypothetical protein